MTEKEKMLSGKSYDCGDKELIARWHEAKSLQQEYNRTLSTDSSKLDQILQELLGTKGKDIWITAPFFIDYGENIHIGNPCRVIRKI